LDVQPLQQLERELPQDALASVSAHLGRVKAGVEKDFRTKIYEDLDRDQVLEALRRVSLPTGYEVFDQLEEQASKKFGSFSIRQPYYEVADKVHAYFEPKHFEITDAVLQAALARVASIHPPGTLKASSLRTAFDNSPKGTNWGLPYFTSNKDDYPKYLEDVEALQRGGWEQGFLWPCVLGVRSQPGPIGQPAKWRPLWMAGHAAIIAELSVQQPLLRALVRHQKFVAWTTPPAIALQITRMLNSRPKRGWISSDMNHYDASMTSQIVHGVFELIRYWFKREDHIQIDWLEYLFLNVALLTPEGILSGRDGGVASGLGMTNMVDTLGQILMDEIIAVLTGSSVEGIYLGDDGAKRFSDESIDPTIYSELYGKMNMVVSVDKSLYSQTEIDFLQRRHSLSYQVGGICVGYRSIVRTGVGVISYETRRILSPAQLAIRAIQQVEQCSDDPQFRSVVQWLFLGSEYLRSKSPDQALEDAGGIDKIKDVLKYRSYPYNQRDISELHKFKTVQILNELRNGQWNMALAS